MPSIVGSIPDKDTDNIVRFLQLARSKDIAKLDYNELLMCLVMVKLGVT